MTESVTLQQISDLLDRKLDEKLTPIHQKLDDHSVILAEHSATLKEHSVILREHSVTLAEHSIILREHSTTLAEHSKILKDQGKTLILHGKMLRKLHRDQGVMLDLLDGKQMEHDRRIYRIESEVGLPHPQFP